MRFGFLRLLDIYILYGILNEIWVFTLVDIYSIQYDIRYIILIGMVGEDGTMTFSTYSR